MQIKGKRTSVESIEVEVSVRDMVDALNTAIRHKHGLLLGDACYINDKGEIEVWEDGRGSGYTTYHGKATRAQVRAEELLDALEEIAKELS